MPKIVLEHLTKRWGNFYGIDDLSLVMEDNSFITLLGPSGCGKTTTLRMIAGLETPTSGRITIGDKVVFDSEQGINVPASQRKVGFLFQNYALWPNMTVYQNITFGLKNVKEEMPLFSYDCKTRDDIIRVLATPDHVVALINDCREKNNKIDEKRAVIKIIDEFIISQMTAKEIFALHLEEGDAKAKADAKINECKAKLEEIKAKLQTQGITVDEQYQQVKDGKVLTKKRKLDPEEIELALRRVARIVKVEEFMDRYPSELSGGQQQRVAIARTLAPGPKVLFMDEPLSNLDAKLRLEMRSELKRLHMETGATFVYVTHDQLEAMTLATKICLLNNACLQQYDAPLDVYNKPNNLFAADFVGNPAMTLVETKIKQNHDGSISLTFFNDRHATFIPNEKVDLAALRKERDKELAAQAKKAEEIKKKPGYVEKSNKDGLFNYHIVTIDGTLDRKDEHEPEEDDYVIGIRPEYFCIAENGAGLDGVVYSAMPSGMETTIKINVDGFILTSVVFGAMDFSIDEKIEISTKGNNISLFDKVTGKRICAGELKFE